MTWSYSGYRQFLKCNRQWYYQHKVAHNKATEPFRREVTVLSKLKSLDAWRGELADQIISKTIYKIWQGWDLNQDDILWDADKTFDQQLDFARKKEYRKKNYQFPEFEEIAALFSVDLGESIEESDIKRAREDIHTSILNFLRQSDLIDYLRTAKKLITQRPLRHPFSKFEVVGRPDLIALFEDEPPHIFDWKVHTFATKTYKDQLVHYALMLSNRNDYKPHVDFPENLADFDVHDYRLTEFQLLVDQVRDYDIDEEDIEEAERAISSGLLGMYRLGGDKPYNELLPEYFPTTFDPEICLKCSFKSICKQ